MRGGDASRQLGASRHRHGDGGGRDGESPGHAPICRLARFLHPAVPPGVATRRKGLRGAMDVECDFTGPVNRGLFAIGKLDLQFPGVDSLLRTPAESGGIRGRHTRLGGTVSPLVRFSRRLIQRGDGSVRLCEDRGEEVNASEHREWSHHDGLLRVGGNGRAWQAGGFSTTSRARPVHYGRSGWVGKTRLRGPGQEAQAGDGSISGGTAAAKIAECD